MAKATQRKRAPRKATCGAKIANGRKCGHPKGWGTDHPGSGRCRFHGGASPNGKKAAGRERALTFARGALGAELAVAPLDALEQSVRLSAGLVDYYRFELAAAAPGVASRKEEDQAKARARIAELIGPYTEAVKLQKDVAKAATDAGVAERRQLLAERTAAMLGAAFEDALSEAAAELPALAEALDAAARSLVVAAFARRLEVLESTADEMDEPLALAKA